MSRWSDLDRTLDMMDELRRRMDWMFADTDSGRARGGFRSLYEDADRAGYAGYGGAGTWPRVSLFDTGTALVLTADVPGLAEKDLKLTVHQDVLTLSGERKSDAPEGYSTHRRERAPASFSRSFALPSKVDAEKTTAQLKNGVLTVTLSKVPEAQPRQIQVQVR